LASITQTKVRTIRTVSDARSDGLTVATHCTYKAKVLFNRLVGNTVLCYSVSSGPGWRRQARPFRKGTESHPTRRNCRSSSNLGIRSLPLPRSSCSFPFLSSTTNTVRAPSTAFAPLAGHLGPSLLSPHQTRYTVSDEPCIPGNSFMKF
jgi:hypothetical protein